jgi:hypothetical protein
MNLRDIREECWDIARDFALSDADRMWPETEMNRYINRTYRYIARETQCIKDATTPAVCLLTVTPVDYTTLVAGTIDYIWANEVGNWLYHKDVTPYLISMHASILQIDEAKWMDQPYILRKVSSSKWKRMVWWERIIGPYATEYATDLQTNKIALNYRMEDEHILQLTVRRMPIADLVLDTDTPEFRTHYHDFMKNGILMQMYRKRDAETLDEAKAAEFERLFLQDVDEIKQQESQMEEHLRPNSALDAFL